MVMVRMSYSIGVGGFGHDFSLAFSLYSQLHLLEVYRYTYL